MAAGSVFETAYAETLCAQQHGDYCAGNFFSSGGGRGVVEGNYLCFRTSGSDQHGLCFENEKHGLCVEAPVGEIRKAVVGGRGTLFVLVGAAVDIRYTLEAGLAAGLMIALALVFRSVGVALCMAGTSLNQKERLFCVIA